MASFIFSQNTLRVVPRQATTTNSVNQQRYVHNRDMHKARYATVVCSNSRAETSCSDNHSRRVFAKALVALPASLLLAGEGQARVCEIGEEGRECREEYLRRDNNGVAAAEYKTFEKRDEGRKTAARKAPSDQKYEETTLNLVDQVESYMSMDVYDKARIPAILKIKEEGNQWVGKYSPGGSSKKESGRAFYSALVSLLGHYSFNGLAPMRKGMEDQITKNCEEAKGLIAKGI